jgi:hypothetical protein
MLDQSFVGVVRQWHRNPKVMGELRIMNTNLPIRRVTLAAATLICAALAGCTLGSNPASVTPIASSIGSIHGQAFGGNQPIVGAQVYVYAAGTGGYGTASTKLSATPAVTDGNGFFTVTNNYTCMQGQQVYLYAIGGNTGSGINTASGMLAILGTCPASLTLASQTPFVWMNEVSTVAAAYAFAGFATDATHVSDDEGVTANTTAALAQTGMANAFASAANLANLATGTALTIPPGATPASTTTGTPPNTVTYSTSAPQAQVNTVADVLAACVNTPSTVASPSSSCATLLSTATSDGTVTGVQPTDTATAAINIAHHPSANVSTLYGLIAGQGAAFIPADATAPADFTLSLLYLQGGSGTVGIAADGLGNIFASYGGGNLVYKITPAGVITATGTSTSSNYVAAPRHPAVDASNNLWVPSLNSGVTTGTIVELSNSLAPLAQCNAVDTTVVPNVSVFSINAVTIAQNGNIWAEGAKSGAAGQAIEVKPDCTPVTSITTLPKGTTDIAINPNGFVGIPSSISNNLSIFDSSGAAIASSPFAGGGLLSPQGIITDATGNFWVTDAAGGVSVLTATGTPVTSTAYSTGTLSLLSGDFDGLGNYFTGSSSTATTTGTIYQLNSSGTVVATYTPPTNTNSFVAVDPSGNLWYGGNHYIAEMIGAGAPKVTPIVTATFNGKLATRP